MKVLPKSITGQEMALRLRNLIRMAASPAAASPLGGSVDGASACDASASGVVRSCDVQPSTLHILERLFALRDENTGKHTERMARYASAIGAAFGTPEAQCQLLRDAVPPIPEATCNPRQ